MVERARGQVELRYAAGEFLVYHAGGKDEFCIGRFSATGVRLAKGRELARIHWVDAARYFAVEKVDRTPLSTREGGAIP